MKRQTIDKLMTVSIILFAYSLIPQIIMNFQINDVVMAWQTIIFTNMGMFIMCVCLYSLRTYVSAIANTIQFTCWFIILMQKLFL